MILVALLSQLALAADPEQAAARTPPPPSSHHPSPDHTLHSTTPGSHHSSHGHHEEGLGLFEALFITCASLSVFGIAVAVYYYLKQQREEAEGPRVSNYQIFQADEIMERQRSGTMGPQQTASHRYDTEVHWMNFEEIARFLETRLDIPAGAGGGAGAVGQHHAPLHGGGHPLHDGLEQMGPEQQYQYSTNGFPADAPSPAGINYFESGVHGLHFNEVSRRLTRDGPNAISPAQKENKFVALLRITFLTGFNVLLWGCVASECVLTLLLKSDDEGGWADLITPMILSAVILGSSLMQWWSEQRAESMLESLAALQTSEKVKVLRCQSDITAGSSHRDRRLEARVEPEAIVVGDLVLLGAGDRVPADARVLFCTDGCEVDQAALTGESLPEPREAVPAEKKVVASEALNLVFSGTLVLKGNLVAVVHATGDATLLGKIAMGVNKPRPRSTFEIAME